MTNIGDYRTAVSEVACFVATTAAIGAAVAAIFGLGLTEAFFDFLSESVGSLHSLVAWKDSGS